VREGWQLFAELLLNNRLQMRVSGATAKLVAQTKQTKIGSVRTGQGELANSFSEVLNEASAECFQRFNHFAERFC
jgi:hypothetical protein